MQIVDLTDEKFPNTREGLRAEIIKIFLLENPGLGRGDLSTKYRYIVSRYNNHEIYLQRPAQFNNGFDFTVHVSGINFNPVGRATTRPTHDNIIQDLNEKKLESPTDYILLKQQVDSIYACNSNHNDWNSFNFQNGLPAPILLHCIKWLFVEQDVTYWNYSGRKMLFDMINAI